MALGLRPGDEIAYVVETGRVILRRFEGRQDVDNPFATFDEWSSEADIEAYGKL